MTLCVIFLGLIFVILFGLWVNRLVDLIGHRRNNEESWYDVDG